MEKMSLEQADHFLRHIKIHAVNVSELEFQMKVLGNAIQDSEVLIKMLE